MNKKGFTLVELIGVITLLGVIALIIFPAVTKTINNSKQTAYEKQVKQIEAAAKQYSIEHTEKLYELDTIYYNKITIQELIDAGYLENVGAIINPKTDEEMTGCVVVTNDSEHNQYLYNYNDNCELPISDYVYQIMLSARAYYETNVKDSNKSANFNGATNLLQLIGGNVPSEGVLYLDKDGNSALAFVDNDTCYTKYFTTNYYQSNNIENCGEDIEIVISSSYAGFGGEYLDSFTDIFLTSDDSYLVLGNSNSKEYDGLLGRGDNINTDAIIVKYNKQGNILWSNNFGGTSTDEFDEVIEEDDCYTVVGYGASNDLDAEGYLTGDGTKNIFVVQYDKQTGEMINEKMLFNSYLGNYSVGNFFKVDGYYYFNIAGRYLYENSFYGFTVIAKFDEDFNHISTTPYGGRLEAVPSEFIMTSNNTFITVGYDSARTSPQGETADIVIGNSRYTYFMEIDPATGNILGKASIGAIDNYATPTDIIEVDDGYVVVGTFYENTGNFLNMHKGSSDIYVAKFSKVVDNNGKFPLLWIKSFGGTGGEGASSAIYYDNHIIVTGYSSSSDYDMEGVSIASNGYRDGLILKYDLNGNLISKKAIGGSDYDMIYEIVADRNELVIVGDSFSKDGVFQTFNYGNKDAFIMTLNNEFEPVISFNIKPLLMNKLPDLVSNYGTTIPTPSTVGTLQLYTTNDPTTELGGWCTSAQYYDSNSNYSYVECLKPFNNSDIITVYEKPYAASNVIDISGDVLNKWMRLNLNSSGGISNLKLKFKNDSFMTIENAVKAGYLEPLVLVGMNTSVANAYNYENIYNLITTGNSGGHASSGSTAYALVLFKLKTTELEQISFNSSVRSNSYGIYSYNNFDISLTQSR